MSLKNVLNELAGYVGDIATNLAAMEAALIDRQLLNPNDIDAYLLDQSLKTRHNLANLRHRIAALPD